MEIEFEIEEEEKYTLLKFNLPGPLQPGDLVDISFKTPLLNGTKGVVISGRGPVWLYGFLVHYYHYAKWVATHDPRVGGAVVVCSHTPDVNVGDVVEL